MNKYVTGALALAVAGTALNADPVNRDWLELDSEINTLATSMNATGDYTHLKVLLRGGLLFGEDDLSTGGGDTLSGVRIEDIDVNGGTQVGDVKVRLGFDLRQGDGIVVQDAYALWDCGEFEVIAGHYKPHLLRTNYTDPENLFFRERSALGSLYDMWDLGVGIRGTADQLSWSLDIMNGDNSFSTSRPENRHYYLGRAVWNINRDPGNYETDPEDSFGAGDDLVGTVGFFFEIDDVNKGEDTDNIGVDFQGTLGQFGFGFEAMKRDDDAGMHYTQDRWLGLSAPLEFEGDSTPWSIFGTFQVDEQFGVGFRYENLDNGDIDDNTVLTIGANMYDVGHNGKLGINVIKIDSDTDDSTIVTAGFTLGASR